MTMIRKLERTSEEVKTRVRHVIICDNYPEKHREYQEVIERHKRRMERGEGKMKERGRMVEHPFGTLKSKNGLHQFLMRGWRNAGGSSA